MEVDRDSAGVVFPFFVQELNQCEFYSVDLEMTGISSDEAPEYFEMSMEETYAARRISVLRYTAFQIGVSLFTKTGASCYEVRPFNFLIRYDAKEIQLQSSALTFLLKHGADFQKFLAKGMPCCNRLTEAALRDGELNPATGNCFRNNEFSEAQRILLESLVSKARDLSEEHQRKQAALDGGATAEECTVELCGDLPWFMQWALQRHVDAQGIPVSIGFDECAQTGFTCVVTATVLSPAKWESLRSTAAVKLECSTNARLGFRRYWNEMVQSKKPFVGHNCFSDLMFLLHMLHEPLSESYQEFKKQVHELFPVIYDTKVLSSAIATNNLRFRTTALEPLFRECNRRWAALVGSRDVMADMFTLPLGFHAYHPHCLTSGGRAHEGAYDAYMTGIVYVLLRHLFPDRVAVYEEHRNTVAVYGSIFAMQCTPEAADPLAFMSAFIVTFDTSVRVELVSMLLMTEAQVVAKRESMKKKGDRQDYEAPDFFVHGLQNSKLHREFIVTLRNCSVTASDVIQRIKAGCAHQLTLHQQGSAPSVASDSAVAAADTALRPYSILHNLSTLPDFRVLPYNEWKSMQTTITVKRPRE